jgi:hypothetical protein
MELMSNGNLREYIMKHRPNAEANPCRRKETVKDLRIKFLSQGEI